MKKVILSFFLSFITITASAQSALYDEFRVNTETYSGQNRPAVAHLPMGGFIVCYQSRHLDGSEWGIFCQLYDDQHLPVGNETQINTYTTNYQVEVDVEASLNGQITVVWQSYQDGEGFGIYGQRLDVTGQLIGSEFRANETTASEQRYPGVAMDAQGGFIVVWEGLGIDGVGVYARRYNASGEPETGEFKVNTSLFPNPGGYPSVAMDPAGNFVVVWYTEHPASEIPTVVVGRAFDTMNQPFDVEFQISPEDATLPHTTPSVAMGLDGRVLVAWQTATVSSDNIMARFYLSNGTPLGTEFEVHNGSGCSNSVDRHPNVDIGTGGHAVITRDCNNQIWARMYGTSGAPLNDAFIANQYSGGKKFPAAGIDGSGNVLIAWEQIRHPLDTSGWGIFANVFGSDICTP